MSHTAEETIHVYRQAMEANYRASTRRGNLVILDAQTAADVLLTGDIHGNEENFDAIVRYAELDQHPDRHVVFQEICHGGPTYNNGGCRSHVVLEKLARLKAKYPARVHHIMSNHELAELTDYPIQKSRQLLNYSFACGMRNYYGSRAVDVRLAMLGYLESCPLAVKISDHVFFSHSIPDGLDQPDRLFDQTVFYRALDPGSDFLRDGSVYRLVWGRDYRQANADLFAKMVGAEILVCGHDPCPDGCKFPNSRQAVIDCCGPTACCMLIPTADHLQAWNYRTYVFPLY